MAARESVQWHLSTEWEWGSHTRQCLGSIPGCILRVCTWWTRETYGMPRDQTQVSSEQHKHLMNCTITLAPTVIRLKTISLRSQLSLPGHTMQSTSSIIPYHITFELT